MHGLIRIDIFGLASRQSGKHEQLLAPSHKKVIKFQYQGVGGTVARSYRAVNTISVILDEGLRNQFGANT